MNDFERFIAATLTHVSLFEGARIAQTVKRRVDATAVRLPSGEYTTTPEALAEMTGRPVEEFRPDDVELPDRDDLETHDADEFYGDDDE